MNRLTAQQNFERQVLAEAIHFTIRRFEGRGSYARAEADTLEQALAAAKEMGLGQYGQEPMIYAINAAGRCVHVDKSMLKKENVNE